MANIILGFEPKSEVIAWVLIFLYSCYSLTLFVCIFLIGWTYENIFIFNF
jgi:hypothetical protein